MHKDASSTLLGSNIVKPIVQPPKYSVKNNLMDTLEEFGISQKELESLKPHKINHVG